MLFIHHLQKIAEGKKIHFSQIPYIYINRFLQINDIEQLTQVIVKFRDDCDWEPFHNPKDLSIAIGAEADKLLEAFLRNGMDKAGMH
jgi:hypothetical protein